MAELDQEDRVRKWRPWFAAVNTPASIEMDVASAYRAPLTIYLDVISGIPSLEVMTQASRVNRPPVVYVAFTSKKRSPFEELPDTRARRATALVEEWLAKRQVTASTAKRLLELINIAHEEYPETEIPSEESLLSTLRFFRGVRDHLRSPSITLTASSGVWIEWRSNAKRAALEFKRDGSVNLAAFYPDPDQPMMPASFAGHYSWKSVSQEIRQKRGLEWLTAT